MGDLYGFYLEAHAKAKAGSILQEEYDVSLLDEVRKFALLLAGVHQHAQPSTREGFEKALKASVESRRDR